MTTFDINKIVLVLSKLNLSLTLRKSLKILKRICGVALSFKVMSMYLRLEDCSFLLWFGVSACVLTSLTPLEAQERSKLQTLQ